MVNKKNIPLTERHPAIQKALDFLIFLHFHKKFVVSVLGTGGQQGLYPWPCLEPGGSVFPSDFARNSVEGKI